MKAKGVLPLHTTEFVGVFLGWQGERARLDQKVDQKWTTGFDPGLF